jgi:hypothetical protein
MVEYVIKTDYKKYVILGHLVYVLFGFRYLKKLKSTIVRVPTQYYVKWAQHCCSDVRQCAEFLKTYPENSFPGDNENIDYFFSSYPETRKKSNKVAISAQDVHVFNKSRETILPVRN